MTFKTRGTLKLEIEFLEQQLKNEKHFHSRNVSHFKEDRDHWRDKYFRLHPKHSYKLLGRTEAGWQYKMQCECGDVRYTNVERFGGPLPDKASFADRFWHDYFRGEELSWAIPKLKS